MNRSGKPKILILHHPAFERRDFLHRMQGLTFKEVTSLEDLAEDLDGVLLLDSHLRAVSADADVWKDVCKGNLLVVAEDGVRRCDFLVPREWPEPFTLKALEAGVRELNLVVGNEGLSHELSLEHEKLFQLTNIGLALSAETDLSRLLTMILTEGRGFATCDGASLFLIERDAEQAQLVFKLTQNDSIDFPFEEIRFPLNTRSIAGFVAVTGRILNIPDVYDIPDTAPYHFNSSFDQKMGYRSRSMLTIPMKNHKKEVIGVLQFINRKTAKNVILSSDQVTLKETMPFSPDLEVLLEALASQAAVAIENSVLLKQIQELFEGFVSASVTAIEQRDPTTSGHSFRVAELTTGLARVLPRSGMARFRDVSFSEVQIQEIRYASLLHDFGKVGVREPVLLKAKKLPAERLSNIWSRFALFKERLKNESMMRRMDFLLNHGKDAFYRALPGFDQELRSQLEHYAGLFAEIEKANEPSILPEGRFNHLADIRDEVPFEVDGRSISLLSEDEFLALSVRKGSLTEQERREIESHVVHTFNFLVQIPWTPELSKVPDIAVSHHEKLNGSGYPHGLSADDIPLPSKLMTIADIYDALTASDRPYKRSMPVEKALSILELESKSGLLDPDLVQVFTESEVFRLVEDFKPQMVKSHEGDHFFKRNVCDYDL